ncbi:MAG TPA: ABC transporter permease [Gaiellaceae bacterium]|nr:ABC transporter permease [Gaiellaceae bacterium]
MVYLSYMFSELRRRRGRTALTAFGLAVGIALVIAVSALSAGLDNAQAKVLKPLTGVGTDMSVTRPVQISNGNLSPSERAQLRKEGGPGRLGFGSLKAGAKFTRTDYMSSELTFAASKVATVKKLANVSGAVGGLNLNLTTVSGTVPKQSAQQQQGPPTQAGPRGVNFNSIAVSGVDPSSTTLGAITSDELTDGTWFTSATKRQAILNVNYATQKNKHVGDTIKLAGKTYTVVGIAKSPVGGSSSDVYIDLTQLQKMSGRTGRINTMYVRATSAGKVATVSTSISKTIPGASVTTAKSLADQITGTLSTAKSLTSKLGLALEAVALIGSLMIASLLTLTSVSKRFRELGTLKAIGWQQRTIVRQIAGESLFQGFLGGVLGVVLGLICAAAITAFGPELKATFDTGSTNNGPLVGPPGAQQAVASAASTTVKLAADVSPTLIVGAVGLAILGGLLSGTVGALRAARLRPADALRHID